MVRADPQGTGEAKLGAKMDGLLTRDLQIRPEAKFAFFIRPLPARAKQLSAQANLFRRRLLKVDTVSKARRRYGLSHTCLILASYNFAGTLLQAYIPAYSATWRHVFAIRMLAV